jgi:hypothetical protein
VETVEKPNYTIIYNGKNVTADLAKYVIEISYEDTVEGESSEITIELENEDGLFSNSWYPQKGDKIELSIDVLDCGKFEVDEVKLAGPPDRVTIRALTNIVTETLHTKRSRAHENKSILQIAQAVAKANGLTLLGQSNLPKIVVNRVTQKRETDLKFLRRIAYAYGIIFSIRDSKLVYTSIYDLQKKKAAISIDKTELTEYEVTDKTSETYKGARIIYHNPTSSKVIESTATVETIKNADNAAYTQITGADKLVVHTKVDNQSQADEMSKSALYRANTQQQKCTAKMPGRPEIVAGNNVELTGLGIAGSGIWQIMKSNHSVSRGGAWVVEIEGHRIKSSTKDKQKGKRPKSSPQKITPVFSELSNSQDWANQPPSTADDNSDVLGE